MTGGDARDCASRSIIDHRIELCSAIAFPMRPDLLFGGLDLALHAGVLLGAARVAEVVGDAQPLEGGVEVLHVLASVVRLDRHDGKRQVVEQLAKCDAGLTWLGSSLTGRR
jgi:hypothetical protein